MSNPQKYTQLDQSVINTLCYSDIFDYPLDGEEVYCYLISAKSYKQPQIKKSLQKLLNQKKISGHHVINRVGESKFYYTLPHREHTITSRISRENISHQKLKISKRVGKWLKKINSIEAVFLTGALAMNNATKYDDIDLMIITAPEKLWLTRLQTSLLLSILGIRRKPEHNHIPQALSDKICTNLYLTSDNLSLSSSRQNLYTAHEVVQAKLLWQRSQVLETFYHNNQWVTSFLPHSPLSKFKNLPEKTTKLKNNPNYFQKTIEKLAFLTQKKYMQSRQTLEVINHSSAFFHPRNTSQIVTRKYHNLTSTHALT